MHEAFSRMKSEVKTKKEATSPSLALGLSDDERNAYEKKIHDLNDRAAIIVDNLNSIQQNSDEYQKTKLHLQEMASQNYMLDCFAKKMTQEKRDTEEKLSAASKQIHEMVKQNTTNAVELKSSQFRLNICTDDLHQEKKKVKMLESILNEKNNWIENEQKKCSNLQTTIQLKNRKIEELKISCTSLETDVTQLMNELRRFEDEPDTNTQI